MLNRKRIFAIVLFVLIGLFVYTFASTGDDLEPKDNNNKDVEEVEENDDNDNDNDNDIIDLDDEEENVIPVIVNAPINYEVLETAVDNGNDILAIETEDKEINTLLDQLKTATINGQTILTNRTNNQVEVNTRANNINTILEQITNLVSNNLKKVIKLGNDLLESQNDQQESENIDEILPRVPASQNIYNQLNDLLDDLRDAINRATAQTTIQGMLNSIEEITNLLTEIARVSDEIAAIEGMTITIVPSVTNDTWTNRDITLTTVIDIVDRDLIANVVIDDEDTCELRDEATFSRIFENIVGEALGNFSMTATKKGIYYACATLTNGEIAKATYEVKNIDKNAPSLGVDAASTAVYRPESRRAAKVSDQGGSGLTASVYKFVRTEDLATFDMTDLSTENGFATFRNNQNVFTPLGVTGTYKLVLVATDLAGNVSTYTSPFTIYLDNTGPVIDFDVNDVNISEPSQSHNVKVKVSDPETNVNKFKYQWTETNVEPSFASFADKPEVTVTEGVFSDPITTPADKDGNWYLWVLAINDSKMYSDADLATYNYQCEPLSVDGKCTVYNIEGKGAFALDNTVPVLEFVRLNGTGSNVYQKLGGIIYAVVKANEPLKNLPVVTMNGQAAYHVAQRTDDLTKYDVHFSVKNETPEGLMTFKAEAFDAAGNKGTIETNTIQNTQIIVDKTKPVIEIKQAPKYSGLGERTIGTNPYSLISFKLSDNNGVKETELNGVLKQYTVSSYSDLNEVRVGDSFGGTYGDNTLILRDVAGNEATISFKLDNVNPVLEFVRLNGTGSNVYQKLGGIIYAVVKINEPLQNLPVVTMNGQAAYHVEQRTDDLTKYDVHFSVTNETSEGLMTFKAEAYDIAGNKGAIETNTIQNTQIIVDKTNPAITIINDSDYTIGLDPYSLISFKLSDNKGIYEVTLNGHTWNPTVNQWGDVNYVAVNRNYGVYGENTITLKDVAGNSVTRTFYLDNRAPEVSFISLEGNGPVIYKKVGATVNATFTTNEALQGTPVVTMNGVVAQSVVQRTDDPTKYDVVFNVTSSMNEGIATFKIETKDIAGNSKVVETTTFDNKQVKIDKSLPTITVKQGVDGNGKIFTIGTNPYKRISFSLYDSEGVYEIGINGHFWNPSYSRWTDANFVEVSSGYGVNGENTIVVRDKAGNEISSNFYLDNVVPQVVGTPTQQYDNGKIKVTAEFTKPLASIPSFQIGDTDDTYWRNMGGNLYYRYYTGTQDVTLNFQDIAGNTNSYGPFTVDNTAPSISVSNSTITVENGKSYNLLTGVTSDATAVSLVATINGNVINNVNELNTVGTYTVTYTATDAVGNPSTATAQLTLTADFTVELLPSGFLVSRRIVFDYWFDKYNINSVNLITPEGEISLGSVETIWGFVYNRQRVILTKEQYDLLDNGTYSIKITYKNNNLNIDNLVMYYSF